MLKVYVIARDGVVEHVTLQHISAIGWIEDMQEHSQGDYVVTEFPIGDDNHSMDYLSKVYKYYSKGD